MIGDMSAVRQGQKLCKPLPHWISTSISTVRSDQVTITLEAEAPPGLVLVIEQAVGHCDTSEARTELFRTSHHDKHGNLVYQKEWQYKKEP